MAAPILIAVSDPRFPGGYAALPDILAATWGTATGQFPESTTKGWATIALPHFATVPLVGVAATTGGAVGSFTPNEGLPIIVLHTVVYIKTASTGAANLNVGVATNATTSANNLITAMDAHTNANVVFDNISDIGASGSSRQLMSGVQALTITGTATTVGFTGTLYVIFVKI